jgi:integrase
MECPQCAPERMRKALTDTFLRALKAPANGRLEYADSSCRGLEFRITQAGARSWSYRYRAPVTGKLSRATIGPYPTVSLAVARLRADELRKGVAGGENPSETKRRAKREAPGRTFKALSERYMKECARRPYGKRLQAKRSADQDERNLNLHVLPKWRDRDYTVIRRADVIELVEGLIAAGKETLANRVQSLVSGVFSFAVDSDLIDANPCTRLKKRGRERVGDRVLTDPEIRLFWQKVVREPISPVTGEALRLQLLVGARPGEIAGIRRSEIEHLDQPGKAVWTVPGERTKNKLPHMVPLESSALKIINDRIAKIEGAGQIGAARKNDFPIFPARNKSDKSMTAHALARAMSRLAEKLAGSWAGVKSWKASRPTPHDLRRTFRTRLPQIGVPADIRDRLMNHIPSDVGSKHYDRYQYLDEKRAALFSWQTALSTILGGEQVSASGGT